MKNFKNEEILQKKLLKLIKSKKRNDNQTIIFLFIGTDRSTGDSYGPLCGTLLKNKNIKKDNIFLIGNLHNPIHALNLEIALKELEFKHPDALIVAIDACLGDSENIGTISIEPQSLSPGKALKKNLPMVGDISIIGTVNTLSGIDFLTLQNTRLSEVYDLATITANTIYYAINNLN